MLFPRNTNRAHQWMSQANGAFSGKRPVGVALERGISGLEVVRTNLRNAGQRLTVRGSGRRVAFARL